LQHLDHVCAIIAEVNIALQLLAGAWRLMGQLVAVETLVFVLVRPRALTGLHERLARATHSLGSKLSSLGMLKDLPSLGEHPQCTTSVCCKLRASSGKLGCVKNAQLRG
jgi:hypothetical protein